MSSLCYVSPRFPPYVGGVETHVSEISKRAGSRFGDVSVISTDPKRRFPKFEQQTNGLRVYRIRSFAPRENYHFPSPVELLRCLREANPRLLHVHSIHDMPGPLAGLLDGRVSVLTPHFVGRMNSTLGRLLFSSYRPVLERLLRKVARVICMSQFERALLNGAFPESSSKTIVIPNGVDPGLSRFSWHDPETPRLLYAGRLEGYKNVDMIIQAVASLLSSYPRLKLTIVGTGPEKPKLVELANGLRIGESVEWFQRLEKSQLYHLFSTSSTVVVPSQFENYGIVAAETISLGVPTVVANSSALAEFAGAGLAVGVEPPVTPEKLEKTLLNVLADPQRYSPRNKGGGFIRSWDEVAEETFALYDSIS